jgi:hypothetical protein
LGFLPAGIQVTESAVRQAILLSSLRSPRVGVLPPVFPPQGEPP